MVDDGWMISLELAGVCLRELKLNCVCAVAINIAIVSWKDPGNVFHLCDMTVEILYLNVNV